MTARSWRSRWPRSNPQASRKQQSGLMTDINTNNHENIKNNNDNTVY